MAHHLEIMKILVHGVAVKSFIADLHGLPNSFMESAIFSIESRLTFDSGKGRARGMSANNRSFYEYRQG